MSDFGGAAKPLAEHPDYKIAILGVPFDEKSSYLRGAAGGPAAVRSVSTGKCYCAYTELGVNLEDETVLVDVGDVDTSGDMDKSFALIEKAVAAILAKGATPIVLGGDHSITYPILKAFARTFKPLDVLHFDAHPDLYEDLYGDRLSHACPFARILEDETVLVDLGDVDTSGDMDKSFALIEKGVAAILAKGATPVVLGGDHSITYPVLKAFARTFKPLDVLHFDAHPDLYEDLYGDRLSHACPFARILEDGLAASVIQVGVRAITAGHRAKALKAGVRMIEMKDIDGPLHLRFTNPVYISFDLDALDPAFAPGVSHHEPGGLTTRQALQVIQSLKGRIVGLDVVELNPSRDPASITAAAAFKIIKETAGRIVRPA